MGDEKMRDASPAIGDTTDKYPPYHAPYFFPTSGSTVYGGIYVAGGPGPNPIILMSSEVGGYDRLTSLFNPLLMAGISVAWYFPRGLWDTREKISFGSALDDLKAAIAYFKTPEIAERHRIDLSRFALGGLSGGGGSLSLVAAAEDPSLNFVMAVSPWNFKADSAAAKSPGLSAFSNATNGRSFEPPSAELLPRLRVIDRASDFVGKKLFIVNGSKDLSNPVEIGHQPTVNALRAAGVSELTDVILDTDHILLTKRRELEELVIAWFKDKCGF